ncbi:MAG: hypothetical protein EOP38_18240 [Rubrivivax sp.]|nr:MAG: hypothetical protein EOP38_18240 [Rubrivivax sp.]
MNKFNRVSAAVLAGMALYGVSGASHALGYGRPTSRAILGETLSVTVPIHLEAGEDVANECVAADVYFGDDKLAALDVQAVFLPGAGRERLIKVTTRKFVNEPVVTVYLAAGCAAKITRKFVAFADPPSTVAPSVGLNVPEPAPVAYAAKPGKVSVGGVTIDTGGGSTIATAPLEPADTAPRIVRRKSAKVAEGASSGSSASPKTRSAAAAGAGLLQGAPSLSVSPGAQAQAAKVSDEAELGRPRAAPTVKTQGSPAKGGGERLMLDPIDADAVVLPNLKMTAAMQGKAEGDEPSSEVKARREAAAALWLAMNSSPDQLARDRQRVHELEQRLANLQQESDKARQQVVALQARVQQAESVQSSPVLVYTLGALAALLGGAVAYLMVKGRRKTGRSDWWKAEPASSESGDPDVATADQSALERTLAQFRPGQAPASESTTTSPPTSPAPVAAPAPVREAPTFTVAPPDKPPVPQPAAAKAPRVPVSEPPREVSVEELIDLEQQAEFFIVLGQDDAAIDLLESHVQSTTGASPLPFLKLLEIYQRLGKRQDYERVQAEFNQRFNGYAPAWESDLLQGHSLPDYPGIVERLQDLWAVPAKAMDVLERSLTRPDANVETFDLPAYRELLFLYAVARDLSERESETREPVDLNLPFVALADSPVTQETIEPLMATRPVKAQPEALPKISLDLSLDDLEPVDSSEVPTQLGGNEIEFEHVDITPASPKPDDDKP